MDYQIFQFPDLLEVFFNKLPNTFGDLLNFVRAFGSMLGLILGVFGIVYLLGKNYFKMNGAKFLIFAGILLIVCGPDYGLHYFRII